MIGWNHMINDEVTLGLVPKSYCSIHKCGPICFDQSGIYLTYDPMTKQFMCRSCKFPGAATKEFLVELILSLEEEDTREALKDILKNK